MAEEATPQQVLRLPLGENDSGAADVRGYLIALLAELWRKGEGFSGKSPFGSSSWECDLHVPLIRAGFIGGKLGENGHLEVLSYEDEEKGSAIILAAIRALGEQP
jgi:hypothetical protein